MYRQWDLLKYRSFGYGHSFGVLCHYYGREAGVELREDIETELKPGMVVNSVSSEEHTSELQSLMRSSYAVFCLKKKNKTRDYFRQLYQDVISTHSCKTCFDSNTTYNLL